MGKKKKKRDGNNSSSQNRIRNIILDNHNEICYSYEHKSSCELYLHIICGCFFVLL